MATISTRASKKRVTTFRVGYHGGGRFRQMPAMLSETGRAASRRSSRTPPRARTSPAACSRPTPSAAARAPWSATAARPLAPSSPPRAAARHRDRPARRPGLDR